ncbi:Mucin-associated surface protein (MASP) [Trypanosoma cruzi]|uniref:Mucin-associated surface protein (MASP), putative n=2 Tax=Trypanosoma cruzi TaxID=5693 RepID=Q4E058_TRYCC|nr:mucin-associated surface protein (MASP), putative [Trypanosoma cruzi]EAN98171.1 mucin-associated surface protein (MASP), putative [Trypanosoma cruzi]PWV09786.1 Mucin-associated surface protein (MASP) [Trypanosoma cruzi]RNC54431.1 mucin-associated surface protein (MASP) [Trypanosoma cruzi]|eukprot:XP_820022.1 mucin-associated surface protein (MASP) [Trypanosoma cruzi strain CL Brener]
MAMMMTGRVLLVCALCVLWCGAVFGRAMNDYCSEGGGNGLMHKSNGGNGGVSLKADCGLLSTRMALINAVEAADEGGLSGDAGSSQKSKESLQDKTLSDDTEGDAALVSGGVVADPPPPPAAAPLQNPGGRNTGEEGKQEELGTKGNEADDKSRSEPGPQKPKTEQSTSSASGGPGTQSDVELALEDTSESNESSNDAPKQEDAGETELTKLSDEEPEKGKSNMALTETNDSQAKQKEIQLPTPTTLPTTRVDEHSSPGDTVTKQQLQKPQSEMEPNNNSQTKSVVTITADQHNEPSADHAGSRPPSPTANGDAANHEADKTTEDGIPNNDPAADGAVTREEKQNENKEVNPKETPAESTVIKTTTATTGDSDGSTAVSHTTSPLLLLLFFACAAAAAVVTA